MGLSSRRLGRQAAGLLCRALTRGGPLSEQRRSLGQPEENPVLTYSETHRHEADMDLGGYGGSHSLALSRDRV